MLKKNTHTKYEFNRFMKHNNKIWKKKNTEQIFFFSRFTNIDCTYLFFFIIHTDIYFKSVQNKLWLLHRLKLQ